MGASGFRSPASPASARARDAARTTRHWHRIDDELVGPYTELLGADIYNNGRGRARPAGVARNTLIGAGYAQLDLRLSHDVKIGRGKDAPAFTLALDAFNVTNRVNDGTFVGTLGSPLFGQAISARPPRQLQFSARFEF